MVIGADYDMSHRLDDQPWYNQEPGEDIPHAVVMHGNLSEGYQAIGPFESFDDAAEYCETHALKFETWIMTLYEPKPDNIPFDGFG